MISESESDLSSFKLKFKLIFGCFSIYDITKNAHSINTAIFHGCKKLEFSDEIK